jgi:hypothetical protein
MLLVPVQSTSTAGLAQAQEPVSGHLRGSTETKILDATLYSDVENKSSRPLLLGCPPLTPAATEPTWCKAKDLVSTAASNEPSESLDDFGEECLTDTRPMYRQMEGNKE